MENENSLTSPIDRDRTKKWRPDQHAHSLTETETHEAMEELNVNILSKFPKVERVYADPPIPLQKIGLFSFVPSKGATPDKDGFFGFAKLRGNFATDTESDMHAEKLIRNVDSYHKVYHTYIGRPFPVTVESKYSADINEIDLRKKMSATISEDVKEKRREEKKEIEDIEQRERNLLDKSKKEEETGETGLEKYTVLRVKKAQLVWTYLRTMKKIEEEVQPGIINAREEIDKMEAEDPSYKKDYYKKFMDARKDIKMVDSEDNFIKYMVEDVELPF